MIFIIPRTVIVSVTSYPAYFNNRLSEVEMISAPKTQTSEQMAPSDGTVMLIVF